MSLALLALSTCTFALGFAEFVAVSLVPAMAKDTGLSVGSVGLLVGAYALGVGIGAPTLSVVLAKAPRRRVLAGCMLVFAFSNGVMALTACLPGLLASRFLAGLMHGVVLALASSTAAAAAGPGRSGQAIATVFAGLTFALVLGVPLGTLASGWLHWQQVFMVVACLAGLGAVGVHCFMPPVPWVPRAQKTSWLATISDRATFATVLTTSLLYTGSFAGFTYISVLLTERTGLAAQGVASLFALYGVSAALGNAWGGRLVDRMGSRRAAWLVTLGVAMSLLGALLGAGSMPAMALVMLIWGLASFGAVPVLQKTVLDAAQNNPRCSPELASGLNIAAFNVGIALGSLLGGLVSHRSPLAPMALGLFPLVFAIWCARGLNTQVILAAASARAVASHSSKGL